jgi:ABC-type Fe3+ transport system permease subunit
MKVSFLLSIALGVVSVIAVTVLWMVLDAIGVFSTVGGTISEATNSGSGGGFDLQSFLSLSHVLGFTTIIAVIDVVLATALGTLGAFIYNMSAGLVGGVEVTLAEDE